MNSSVVPLSPPRVRGRGGDGGYGGVGGGYGGGVPPRRCFTKISDMTERYQDELHGVLGRNPRRPKTCTGKLMVDKFHK